MKKFIKFLMIVSFAMIEVIAVADSGEVIPDQYKSLYAGALIGALIAFIFSHSILKEMGEKFDQM